MLVADTSVTQLDSTVDGIGHVEFKAHHRNTALSSAGLQFVKVTYNTSDKTVAIDENTSLSPSELKLDFVVSHMNFEPTTE